MSRVSTLVLGLLLLAGAAWIAVSMEAVAARLLIVAGIPSVYTHSIFNVVCLALAAGIGIGAGWSLRAVTADEREVELRRRVNDTKGRIPRLESEVRNKEIQVGRVEQQMQNLEDMLLPLHKSIEERDLALRDRDRTVSLLQGELAALKRTSGDDHRAGDIATLNLDDETDSWRSADTKTEELEERVRELQARVSDREARIAELMQDHGGHSNRVPELERELENQRRRSEDYNRERQRQDKWLDVLNEQLGVAREANDRMTAELRDRASLQQRVVALEAEVNRLGAEIADRERRLAASRFECATARTTIAHLQALKTTS